MVSAVQKLTLPYRDSATGEILDEKQTLEGMRLEMQNLADAEVFKPAACQRQQMQEDTSLAHVGFSETGAIELKLEWWLMS